jgi:hypothetical protein
MLLKQILLFLIYGSITMILMHRVNSILRLMSGTLFVIFQFFLMDSAYHTAESQAPNLTQKEIVLGMSTALEGPTSYLGVNVRDGIETAIHEINQSGGIHGHTIRLVCLDDGYEPQRTIPNIYKLANEENVLAIIGDVGTPTAVAAIPIIEKNTFSILWCLYWSRGFTKKSTRSVCN